MIVKPFQGWRYDAGVVGDAGTCIAPPYDVIDEAMQQQLHDRSPFNIVRITRGKISPGDTEQNNQYTRAARFMDELIDKGAIKQDPTEAIYGYVQDFEIGREHHRRTGIIALGKLEEFGAGVQPHEKTLDGPKADRLKLMRAKAAQLGQIFMLYDDPETLDEAIMARAATRPALLDFVDDNQVRHRLYTVEDQADIQRFAAMITSKPSVIADGHHRYEVALMYYHETGNPAAQYRMMTFVNMRNEGLIILPTHRLVRHLSSFDLNSVLTRIRDHFEVIEYAIDGQEKKAARDAMFEQMQVWFRKSRNAFGLYAGTKAFYALTLKNASAMDLFQDTMSPASRSLDVNVLHKLILENVLNIGDQQLADESHLEYIKDLGDAIEKSVARVDDKSSQAVFFMNPTRIEQVKAVAAAGEKMPQKSTFFYPKIYTGLVLHKL
ncbi:MAG: DUF1015 domain-containing protein [Sedimentisphaerales bacterium]|nr:DUF1015 domain-containing protein [Sedimentisphaerales bacterium]